MIQFLKVFKFWKVAVLFLAAANLLYLTHDFLGWLVTLSFFLFVPGYLLLSLMQHEIKTRGEILSFSLGLSLLFLMVSGLVLNSLHAVGLTRPLATWDIFAILDTSTLILIFFNRNKSISLINKLPAPSKHQVLVTSILTLLPVLAIGGAIRLNNGASNILTMVLFALIAFLFVVLVRCKKWEKLYPYAVMTMGLSILLTVSLRGWLVTGHDIQREFYVFQLTSKAGYWNIAAFRDPYNACLSITILPTIISKITTISAPYVFKVVFQAIFAFSLIPVFFFMKRLSNSVVAFMGAFVFISFPVFLNDMPFLNRQEIAFVFFGLLMLTTFLEMKRRPKTILSISLLIGLIISHYSSSYVTLGLLVMSWIFYKLFQGKRNVKIKNNRNIVLPLLSLSIIFVAFLFTFAWNSQITTTTAGLKSTLSKSLDGLIDSSSAQSGDVSYSLFSPSSKSPPELLADYAGDKASQVQYVGEPNLPFTKFGKLVSHVIDPTTINSIVRAFTAKILQILLLIGTILLFLKRPKKSVKKELYYIALSVSCVIMLILQTILPQVSVDYGSLRFFQQVLIILGVPIVLGLELLLYFLKQSKTYVMALFFAFLFLDLSGFVPQLIGGYSAQLALNNSGTYYDAYYVHTGEIKSADWLLSNNSDSRPVAMDSYAQIRFLAPIISKQITVVSPFNKTNNDYFYRDYGNIHHDLYYANLSGNVSDYLLLDQSYLTSNQVYVNQASDVYGP
jgi:uncharacterized membrane protein